MFLLILQNDAVLFLLPEYLGVGLDDWSEDGELDSALALSSVGDKLREGVRGNGRERLHFEEFGEEGSTELPNLY